MKQRKVNLKSVSGWGQLTPKQFLKVAKIASRQNYESSFKTKVYCALNGLRVKKGVYVDVDEQKQYHKYFVFQKNGYRKFLIDRDVFVTMLESFNWLEGDITLMKNYPRIAGRRACDHRLYDTCLEQFLFADQLYAEYSETAKLKVLRRFNAVFYCRKFKSSTNKRKSFKFRFTSKAKLYSTYLWYTGVKKWIMGKYPYLFQSGSGAEVPPDESIMNMLSALNGGDITKNKSLLKSPVHEALHQLNQMAEKVQHHV